jgi:hypothetical protein
MIFAQDDAQYRAWAESFGVRRGLRGAALERVMSHFAQSHPELVSVVN